MSDYNPLVELEEKINKPCKVSGQVDAIIEDQARLTCTRCGMGHSVIKENGEWIHGVDQIDSSRTYIPPEPCAAAPLWEVLKQLRSLSDSD